MRFVATADLQIGMELRWLGEAQPRFDQARIDTIRSIGRIVERTGAEAVVVGGDLFDRVPVAEDDLMRTMEAVGELTVPFLVLPGNHDSHSPGCVWLSDAFAKERPDNLTLLLDDPVVVGDVEFVGAPLMTRHPDGPTLHHRLERLEPDGRTRIVVGHGAVTQVVGDHQQAAAFDQHVIEAALADGRATFVVLGDRHSTLSVGDTGRIWYPGAPEPTDFDDDEGHVLVVTIEEDGSTAVEREQTGTWRFLRFEPDVSDLQDVESLLATISAIPQKSSVNLKVRPTGVLPLDAYRALEAGFADAEKRFASAQTFLTRVELLPDADEVDALGLAPYVRHVFDELLAASREDPEDEDSRTQLNLLLRTAREVGE